MHDIISFRNAAGSKVATEHDKIQFLSALEFIDVIDFSKFKRVADVGSGPGHQAFVMQCKGSAVTCVDYVRPIYDIAWRHPDDQSDFQVDAVWSHHCLEHIPNPTGALLQWRRMLSDGGRLFLTVPEIGHTVSSGHINNFNLTQLVYLLAVCGFDCSEKSFTRSRSHLRADVKKSKLYDPNKQGTTTSLNELADYGLFPPSATKAIRDRNRFSAHNLHFSWSDKLFRPNSGSEEAYDFIARNMWDKR
jgi:SAM-dependent methyltransferase